MEALGGGVDCVLCRTRAANHGRRSDALALVLARVLALHLRTLASHLFVEDFPSAHLLFVILVAGHFP